MVFYDIALAKPQVLKLELISASDVTISLCQYPNLLRPCFKSLLPFIVFKLGLDNSFKALVRTRGEGVEVLPYMGYIGMCGPKGFGVFFGRFWS